MLSLQQVTLLILIDLNKKSNVTNHFMDNLDDLDDLDNLNELNDLNDLNNYNLDLYMLPYGIYTKQNHNVNQKLNVKNIINK